MPLVDNCSSHIIIQEFSNIKIFFLPKNSISVLQPLDQSIISLLKVKHRSHLCHKIVTYIDSELDNQISNTGKL